MIKLLIYIKHHVSFIWSLVEWLNTTVFYFLYGHELGNQLNGLLEKYKGKFSYRLLDNNDMYALSDFFLCNRKTLLYFLNLMLSMYVR